MARKLALLIGNAEYHDPKLSKLNAPSVDIDRLAALLQLPGAGFDVKSHKNEAEAPLTREIESFFSLEWQAYLDASEELSIVSPQNECASRRNCHPRFF